MEYTRLNVLQKIKSSLNSKITSANFAKGGVFNFIKKQLGLKTKGLNNSQYSPKDIILLNGQTITLRLADHPAVESNFKTNLAISIVVRKNNYFVLEYKNSTIYEEIFYDSDCLDGLNIQQAVTEILQGIAHALETDGTFLKGELGEYIVKKDNNLKGIMHENEQCRICKHSKIINGNVYCEYCNFYYDGVPCFDFIKQ